jgi:hypothetical protein
MRTLRRWIDFARWGRRVSRMALAVCLWPAQDARAADPARPPRDPSEVTIGDGRFLEKFGDPLHEALLEVTATVPLTNRFAIEAFVNRGSRERFEGRSEGMFAFQIQQRLRPVGPLQPFLTYGLSGYYYSDSYPGARIVVRFSQVDFGPIPVVGGGLSYRVSRHLALRGDMQAICIFIVPVGVRVTGGVSIPLGVYPPRSRSADGESRRAPSYARR